MKDRLEEFILENREAFDMREPSPSLWLKINPENSKKKNQAGRIAWFRYTAAAAVIFAAVSAGIFFLSGVQQNKQLYGEQYLEIAETEAYYNALVSRKYNELQPYFSSSPQLRNELDYDMSELDEIYEELKEDLKDNVGNPEVIEAMVQQYRIKVELLEDLLDQLKEKENQNYEEEKKISL